MNGTGIGPITVFTFTPYGGFLEKRENYCNCEQYVRFGRRNKGKQDVRIMS